MAKPMQNVRKIVLAYGADPRNKWLNDPKGKENVDIVPKIDGMPGFTDFFADFTDYIRVGNSMNDVIMTPDGLKECTDWGSLVGYVFDLQ
jgi:hypothetical protein